MSGGRGGDGGGGDGASNLRSTSSGGSTCKTGMRSLAVREATDRLRIASRMAFAFSESTTKTRDHVESRSGEGAVHGPVQR